MSRFQHGLLFRLRKVSANLSVSKIRKLDHGRNMTISQSHFQVFDSEFEPKAPHQYQCSSLGLCPGRRRVSQCIIPSQIYRHRSTNTHLFTPWDSEFKKHFFTKIKEEFYSVIINRKIAFALSVNRPQMSFSQSSIWMGSAHTHR